MKALLVAAALLLQGCTYIYVLDNEVLVDFKPEVSYERDTAD